MERMEDAVQGTRPMKTVRFVARLGALFLLALVAASVVLAAAGCAVPYVERPAAAVYIVPAA